MAARPGGSSAPEEEQSPQATEEDFQRLVAEQCDLQNHLPMDVLRSLLQTLDPTGPVDGNRAWMTARVGSLVLAKVQLSSSSPPCHKATAQKRLQSVCRTLQLERRENVLRQLLRDPDRERMVRLGQLQQQETQESNRLQEKQRQREKELASTTPGAVATMTGGDTLSTSRAAFAMASAATMERPVPVANHAAPMDPSAGSIQPVLPLESMNLHQLAAELLSVYKIDVDDFPSGFRHERAVQVLKEQRAAQSLLQQQRQPPARDPIPTVTVAKAGPKAPPPAEEAIAKRGPNAPPSVATVPKAPAVAARPPVAAAPVAPSTTARPPVAAAPKAPAAAARPSVAAAPKAPAAAARPPVAAAPKAPAAAAQSMQAKQTKKVQFSLPVEERFSTVIPRRESVATHVANVARAPLSEVTPTAPTNRSPTPPSTAGDSLSSQRPAQPEVKQKLTQRELQDAVREAASDKFPLLQILEGHRIGRNIASFRNFALNILNLDRRTALESWEQVQHVELAALAEKTRKIVYWQNYYARSKDGQTKTPPTSQHSGEHTPQALGSGRGQSSSSSNSYRAHDGDVGHYGPSVNRQTTTLPTAPSPREGSSKEPTSKPLGSLWEPPSNSSSGQAREGGGETSGRSDERQVKTLPAVQPIRKANNSEIVRPARAPATKTVTMTVRQEAVRTFSRTEERSATRSVPLKVVYNESSVNAERSREVALRWNDWEPFWEAVGWVKLTSSNRVSLPQNEPAAKTAFWARLDGKTVGMANIKQDDWGMARTEEPYEDGDTRLLFFTIPLAPPTKKRSDGHVWPIGTFLQLTTTVGNEHHIRPIHLKQRSETNLQKWTGMCHVLDLTPNIKDPKTPTKIEAITHDENLFYACAIYAKYRSPETLFNLLMDDKSPDLIRKLTEEEGLEKVKRLFSSTVVVHDSDSEDGDGETEEAGKSIFSLKDAFSAKLIRTPVRGKNCTHFQCFDLMTFLEANTILSGNRWRCLSCEKFISWSNLEYCGFTAKLVEEFASEASRTRDRVEVTSSGLYRLLEETSRKRKMAPNGDNDNNIRSRKARVEEPEIIDCEVLIL